MKIVALSLAILLLHGPTGREIRLNTKTVTSLHAPEKQGRNQAITSGANCLINTTDGKFISVVETCAEITRMIEGPK